MTYETLRNDFEKKTGWFIDLKSGRFKNLNDLGTLFSQFEYDADFKTYLADRLIGTTNTLRIKKRVIEILQDRLDEEGISSVNLVAQIKDKP